MASRIFSTREIPQRQAFAYWRELVCDSFIQLECSSPHQNEFHGSFEIQSFGHLEISSMHADELHVQRTAKSIRASGESYFIIPIQERSFTKGSQDGREFLLRPGDFTLFDSTRPYQASLLSKFEHCLIRVPRPLLHERLGSIDRLTAVNISGDSGIGKVASTFLRTLPSQLEHVSGATRTQLSETALDLITMALAERFSIPAKDSSAISAHRIRVKAFVEANLKREDLSVEMIGRTLRLSTRHLNRLFKDEDTSLWKYILERRLDKCRSALEDNRLQGRTISEIAYHCGFSDVSHFSRTFHRRFGVSPRDYRSTKLSEPEHH